MNFTYFILLPVTHPIQPHAHMKFIPFKKFVAGALIGSLLALMSGCCTELSDKVDKLDEKIDALQSATNQRWTVGQMPLIPTQTFDTAIVIDPDGNMYVGYSRTSGGGGMAKQLRKLERPSGSKNTGPRTFSISDIHDDGWVSIVDNEGNFYSGAIVTYTDNNPHAVDSPDQFQPKKLKSD